MSIKMSRYLVLVLFLVSFSACSARTFRQIPLPPGVIGPESLAFDCDGKGPYVGVSDGRILQLDGQTWTEFAKMPNWSPSCFGPNNEGRCGRPLGLKFHPHTCDLYVADAYHGLVVVGRQGGDLIPVVQGAEGLPFRFTNSVDINPVNGFVYFTDTSIQFERWQYQTAIDTADRTGRLMVYNPSDHSVRVLLHGLSFANGVALSLYNNFLLISETTTGQIHRFWLTGPRYHTSDLLVTLGGRPDNINRDSQGNFWIAQVRRPGDGRDAGMPIKINWQGQILERLDARSGGVEVTGASDVKEFDGRLWIGSVVHPYIQVSY